MFWIKKNHQKKGASSNIHFALECCKQTLENTEDDEDNDKKKTEIFLNFDLLTAWNNFRHFHL